LMKNKLKISNMFFEIKKSTYHQDIFAFKRNPTKYFSNSRTLRSLNFTSF
jgi:hypothetical protein